jgi:hypothetical protein
VSVDEINSQARTYLLVHANTQLLHGTIELFEGDLATVLDVKVLEHLGHELHLVHVRRILLHDFSLELLFEPVRIKGQYG